MADSPNLLSKFRSRLNKGDSFLTRDIGSFFAAEKLRADALEDFETRLLMADTGIDVTQWLVDRIQTDINLGRIKNEKQLRETLKKALVELLAPVTEPLTIPAFIKPYILFVAGVNGVGKTTTIGKMAMRFKREGKSVLLAAGDTFRAAAVQQLTTWADRAGVPILSQGEGADSASVIYDAVQSAKARNIDIVIADTAGRLHTQSHLMDELRKIKRVVQKADASAPHEVLLVIDGNTGQNALHQVKAFDEALTLTGLIITKLDGTAKGGVLCAIAREKPVPVYFIGVGEKLEDLETFDAREFAQALLA
ncbi:MAG: signal recognition particle-docking protein FtsY [Hydrogenophaga sp.]|nr:signal recognition particle-docking protein FtsY [Hydrogenophaga sp.]